MVEIARIRRKPQKCIIRFRALDADKGVKWKIGNVHVTLRVAFA